MKKLKVLAALLVIPVVAVSMLTTTIPVSANDAVRGGVTATGGDSNSDLNVQESVKNIVNWLLFAVGVIAVIMLIWGGIKYATSAGDSNKVTSAKNTIMYAVIGLAVALLAFAIVNFVINSLESGSISGPGA